VESKHGRKAPTYVYSSPGGDTFEERKGSVGEKRKRRLPVNRQVKDAKVVLFKMKTRSTAWEGLWKFLSKGRGSLEGGEGDPTIEFQSDYTRR